MTEDKESDYKRGQRSIWSFIVGWSCALERVDKKRDPATDSSHYSARLELDALIEKIKEHYDL